jgi:hypothetical protein
MCRSVGMDISLMGNWSNVTEIPIFAAMDSIEIGEHEPDLLKNPDVLDAVVCVVAGMDFIAGGVMHPEKSVLAKREGWIWVRPIKK